MHFPEDDDLVRRARTWATGATVHNVNNLIGTYRAAVAAANVPTAAPGLRLHALATADAVRNRLEAYMTHGDYARANSAFPLPYYLPPDASPEETAEHYRWQLYAARRWLRDLGRADLADSLNPAHKFALDASVGGT